MLMMKSNKRLVVAVVLAVIGLGLLASVALALPASSWTKWYYSDPDFQNWIGERTLFCDGSGYREGSTSPYVLKVVAEGCNGGGYPTNVTCYIEVGTIRYTVPCSGRDFPSPP
jgi:hypothetical protein